jgi:HKD family nuclease
LKAVFSKINSPYADLEKHISSLLPSTGLRQSELFTGNKSGVSLESEIRKEIETADEIQWIVSFIRFSGLRIFLQALQEFTKKGKKIKIITTTYMGATEPKAIEELAKLPNTEIKISYNTKQERVHAKAYLFLRNTNFNTGYIGSSNISRTALTSGLEWNLKITTQEIPHVIDKFQKTFDTYWNDSEFEFFDINIHKDKLRNAIDEEKYSKSENNFSNFFDITPHNFQKEILERLLSERTKGNFRNLVIAATGTGKTVIIQDLLRSLQETSSLEASAAVSMPSTASYMTVNINFSAQTSSLVTQMTIEGKLEKKRKKSKGAKGTFKTLIFIDDVNMPAVE